MWAADRMHATCVGIVCKKVSGDHATTAQSETCCLVALIVRGLESEVCCIGFGATGWFGPKRRFRQQSEKRVRNLASVFVGAGRRAQRRTLIFMRRRRQQRGNTTDVFHPPAGHRWLANIFENVSRHRPSAHGQWRRCSASVRA
jgi:hypothetical protein